MFILFCNIGMTSSEVIATVMVNFNVFQLHSEA